MRDVNDTEGGVCMIGITTVKSERKSRAIEENTENHNLPEESTDGCAGGIVVMGQAVRKLTD